MLVERIELRLLNLPLVEPFVAAHGTTSTREIVVVAVETDIGRGWGECSALPEPTYTEEFAAGAYLILEDELAPRLVGHRLVAGDVIPRLTMVAANPMAKAALEMALLDVELRADELSLAEHLGVTRDKVTAGVAVGLGPPEAVAERVALLAAEGFSRVKLKIKPGNDLDVVRAVRAAAGVEIQVDGNGSYRPGDLEVLVEIAAQGVSAIEQPFAIGDPSSAAALVQAVGGQVLVVADEAANSVADIDRLHRDGAASAVSIKPPRLGGLAAAVRVVERCRELALTTTAGGMVESGLGRHGLAAVAALDGFDLTGDLSPAHRWLAADPWPDLVLDPDGTITLPSGPGVAPDPDPDILTHHTIKQTTIR